MARLARHQLQMPRPAKDKFGPRQRFAACIWQGFAAIFANTDDGKPRIIHATYPAFGRHH